MTTGPLRHPASIAPQSSEVIARIDGIRLMVPNCVRAAERHLHPLHPTRSDPIPLHKLARSLICRGQIINQGKQRVPVPKASPHRGGRHAAEWVGMQKRRPSIARTPLEGYSTSFRVLLGLARSTEKKLRTAFQMNVFRLGNDHRSLGRARRGGIE